MGVLFLEHPNGSILYCCGNCLTDTPLTNRDHLISTEFQSASGPAFLFKKAVNLKESPAHVSTMITGRHITRHVYCKKCDQRLGWYYEFCEGTGQRYKEGCVVLERAFIKETEGFKIEDFYGDDNDDDD